MLAACDDMNSLHNKYLEEGEIVYMARFDSLKINPGYKKAEFIYWLSDPKGKNVEVNWAMGEAKFRAPVSVTTLDAPGRFVIEDMKEEGNLNFIIYVYDANFKERSMAENRTLEIPGERYVSSLNKRNLKFYTYDADDRSLKLDWVTFVNERSIGTELTYLTSSGIKVDTIAKPGALFSHVTVLEDVVRDSEFSYRTLYLPVANCLDIFSTQSEKFSVIANKWTEPMRGPHVFSAAEPYLLHIFNYDIGFPVSLGVTYNTTKTGSNAAGTSYRIQYGDAGGTRLGFEGGVPPLGNIGSIALNEWCIYTINVQDAGSYKVTTQVGTTGSATARYRLEVDGVAFGDSGQLPNTGGWAAYQPADYPQLLTFIEGEHKIRFYVTATGFNIRSFTFTYQP